MGVNISSYRARVGLFYCICIRTKHSLSLIDIICINIMLQNGICSLPAVLLTHMFYGISTHKDTSVLMKSSPRNVKTNSNTCIFSSQHSVSVSFIFNALLCLLYIFCLNILSGDIETNPGPSPTEHLDHYSDSSSFTSHSSTFSATSFSFVHLNVQSIIPKLDLLETELFNHSILSFTETWLADNLVNSEIHLTNFQPPFCYCRNTGTLGGGVAVYVKDHIFAKRRADLEIPTVECVWIEFVVQGQKYLYGTFYRPPNSPASLWDDIELSLDLAYNTNITNIIITGDFNANLFVSNSNSNRLQDIFRLYGMSQCLTEPTHFTEHSSSLLDIIAISSPNILAKSSVGENFLGQYSRYHCPIYGLLSKPLSSSTCFRRDIWLFNHGNYHEYRERLNSIDWDEILLELDIDACIEKINQIVIHEVICVSHTRRQS